MSDIIEEIEQMVDQKMAQHKPVFPDVQKVEIINHAPAPVVNVPQPKVTVNVPPAQITVEPTPIEVASPDLSEVVMGLRDVITTTHSFKDDSVAFYVKM